MATRKTAAGPAPTTSAEVDRCLAAMPEDQRDALQKLRQVLLAAAKGGVDGMSYKLPAVLVDGRVLVMYGASSKHCAFYPGCGSVVAEFADELTGFDTSKGTIRFQPDRPLPAALVRKIVQHRLAQVAAATEDKKSRR